MLLLLIRRDDNNGVNLLLLRRTQRLNVFLIFFPNPPALLVVEPGGWVKASIWIKCTYELQLCAFDSPLGICLFCSAARIYQRDPTHKNEKNRSTFWNISCISERVWFYCGKLLKKPEKRNAHIIYEMNKKIFIRLFFTHSSWSCSLNILTRCGKREKWLRSHWGNWLFINNGKYLFYCCRNSPARWVLTTRLLYCDRLLIFLLIKLFTKCCQQFHIIRSV